jgi:hypothetical protein
MNLMRRGIGVALGIAVFALTMAGPVPAAFAYRLDPDPVRAASGSNIGAGSVTASSHPWLALSLAAVVVVFLAGMIVARSGHRRAAQTA